MGTQILALQSTISRTIEIDLNEMLGVENIPAARTPNHFIQM
ncbi:hypothetical protein [Niastella yeongjuensis]|nr:hypothetical protein [Niastella yeongjuensis]SEO98741.1 hypothetical protein SAMN05660816_04073 [Niastella yeongjuensis]